VPEYVEGRFQLSGYTKVRKTFPNHFFSLPIKINDVRKTFPNHFFSLPIKINDYVWRLKVYPNGNGTSRGSFLGVFLCMEKVI